MLTEKSKNLIKEELLSLPKEVQEAINAFAWEKISEEIGKKYLLDENEIETFQLETASFLLGLVDEDSYPKNIEDGVGTSKDEAEKISNEAFEKIFTPINDILIENIKKSGKSKDLKWDQNLDFILSGGDYSAFVEENPIVTPETPRIDKIPVMPVTADGGTPPGAVVNTPTLADIKANAQKTNMPARSAFSTADAGGPIRPGKMDDIKSKFTI